MKLNPGSATASSVSDSVTSSDTMALGGGLRLWKCSPHIRRTVPGLQETIPSEKSFDNFSLENIYIMSESEFDTDTKTVKKEDVLLAPLWYLILHDDDDHTYEYVEKMPVCSKISAEYRQITFNRKRTDDIKVPHGGHEGAPCTPTFL